MIFNNKLCINCDLSDECEVHCEDAINYKPLDDKYRTNEKYVSKGTNFGFRNRDGSLTNNKYLRK